MQHRTIGAQTRRDNSVFARFVAGGFGQGNGQQHQCIRGGLRQPLIRVTLAARLIACRRQTLSTNLKIGPVGRDDRVRLSAQQGR